MRIGTILFLAVLLLTGCVQPPQTPAFTGPIAHLSMTEIARGPVAANVAYVAKINGADFLGEVDPGQPPPDTPLDAVTGVMTTVDIPAGPGTYSVVGHSIFQAPIFGITMDAYCLGGDIKFTPVANATYILEGTFTRTYSALWIQNPASNTVEGNKIEIHGSATMSFMKKTLGNPDDCVPPAAS